ncbi:hypothetical protein [Streptomyces spiramyceticus]|nr:hypothetical protein [Streptomyces spiramyceticus]
MPVGAVEAAVVAAPGVRARRPAVAAVAVAVAVEEEAAVGEAGAS